MKKQIIAMMIGLSVLATGCGGGASSEPSEPATTAAPAETTTKAPEKKSGVTAENYHKIKMDMSYDDVKKVMGGEGILMSESKIMDIESSIYSWYASDHISNCTITMQNGKVSSKAQAGLK